MARKGKDKQPRKHSGRPRKEAIVADLIAKLEASKAVVFADYQGLTNKQTEDMKKTLREANASFAVTKNSLLKLSLSKSHFADQTKDLVLEKPTAALFINEDAIIPLKAIAKAFKEFNLPKVKFGIIDGQAVDEEGVLKLASLPSREVLLGQLAGMLNSPMRGLVVTLNGTLQKLVIVLEAVAKSKPADAPPPQPTTEQPQTEAQAPATEPSVEVKAEETAPKSQPEPITESEAVPESQSEASTEVPAADEPEAKPNEQPENQKKTEGGDLNG